MRTLDGMMARMGFGADDTGPNVAALRDVVATEMAHGMVDHSAGTWAPGKHSAEERAAAMLEVHRAIERGDYVELTPEDWDD